MLQDEKKGAFYTSWKGKRGKDVLSDWKKGKIETRQEATEKKNEWSQQEMKDVKGKKCDIS